MVPPRQYHGGVFSRPVIAESLKLPERCPSEQLPQGCRRAPILPNICRTMLQEPRFDSKSAKPSRRGPFSGHFSPDSAAVKFGQRWLEGGPSRQNLPSLGRLLAPKQPFDNRWTTFAQLPSSRGSPGFSIVRDVPRATFRQLVRVAKLLPAMAGLCRAVVITTDMRNPGHLPNIDVR